MGEKLPGVRVLRFQSSDTESLTEEFSSIIEKKLTWTRKKLSLNDCQNVSRRFELIFEQDADPTAKEDDGKVYKWQYFCDWYPKLFGVDEEWIPSSGDEEGLFEDPEVLDELEAKAQALTSSELELFRYGMRNTYSDDELRKAWVRQKIPVYGRRARAKPILEREDHTKFECICDIDRSYSRHYIPKFHEKKDGDDEMKTPHFVAFWDDYYEKKGNKDLEELSKIFDPKIQEETAKAKTACKRRISKFMGLNMKNKAAYRQEILNKFRPLDCREIRRYRMPFAEALYLELQEDRYLESAAYFKHLLIKDYFENVDANPPTVGLRQSKVKLIQLITFLKLAEKMSQRKEYHKEAIIYLKVGKYFNEHDSSWWWLAEELYVKAVNVSTKSVIDGGKSEAISRYILGIFLLDYVYRVQPAREHLMKARELSMGKDWNAGNVLKKPQGPVYKECTNYLCQALIAASRELRLNKTPEKALPLIHRSYKLCCEEGSARRDIEMETYFELGLTYRDVGLLDWAETAFKKFILIAQFENQTRRICDGYLELAICYRSEGDNVRCYNNLLNYKETAEAHCDENLLAFAHRYLGEFYLNKGYAKKAAECLSLAFRSFYTQCVESKDLPEASKKPEHLSLPNDVELARVLVGLAQGEIYFKPIFELLFQTKQLGTNEILTLIHWKNTGELPMDPEESQVYDSHSFENVPNMISEEGERKISEGTADSHESSSESESNRVVRFATRN